MRALPEGIAAGLAAGVTTLAHVWRIERRDGALFGFTDHDRPLAVDALLCEPNVGLSAGVIDKCADLGVDSAGFSGALVSEAITEADLARGLWDGARVDLYRVNWNDPGERIHLFSGRIGQTRRGVSAFEAELRGLQAPLNVPVGRVFSRYCDADLGDARCGKDIESPTFRGTGVVTTALSTTTFTASGLEAFAEGWFSRGRLAWSAGGESEVASHHTEGAAAAIEVLDPTPVIAAGAAFTIYAGCDKRLETCAGKFSNTLNFRGFPHMPGNDAIQARPSATEALDGSSRFR